MTASDVSAPTVRIDAANRGDRVAITATIELADTPGRTSAKATQRGPDALCEAVRAAVATEPAIVRLTTADAEQVKLQTKLEEVGVAIQRAEARLVLIKTEPCEGGWGGKIREAEAARQAATQERDHIQADLSAIRDSRTKLYADAVSVIDHTMRTAGAKFLQELDAQTIQAESALHAACEKVRKILLTAVTVDLAPAATETLVTAAASGKASGYGHTPMPDLVSRVVRQIIGDQPA